MTDSRGHTDATDKPTTSDVVEMTDTILAALRAGNAKNDLGPVLAALELITPAGVAGAADSAREAAAIVAACTGDIPSVIATLLHQPVADGVLTIHSLRSGFGDGVAVVMTDLLRLDRVRARENQVENVRKMLVAMSRRSARALSVGLAERCVELRRMPRTPQREEEERAREAMLLYAPLAEWLRLPNLHAELEDLAFDRLYPKRRSEIAEIVATRFPAAVALLEDSIDLISTALQDARLTATVAGRVKSHYATYRKMVRGRDFFDINDVLGVRVIVETIRDCYAALGVLHEVWSPIPGQFVDYIARPKYNLYQAVHTTVLRPPGVPLEIQIQSTAMYRLAEAGPARRTELSGELPNVSGPATFMQLVQATESLSATDPADFLDTLRFPPDMAEEIYVFTPQGDVIALRGGATAIDFAYAIHTEVGHRCIGAIVNGRLVDAATVLDNGDTVNAYTTHYTANVNADWLHYVVTRKARTAIRHALREHASYGRVDDFEDPP
jgi:guanosine-3',5'-bis(diphosphate) 3'-pyrophosphohydrolase